MTVCTNCRRVPSALHDRGWLSRRASTFKGGPRAETEAKKGRGAVSLTASKAVTGLRCSEALVDEGDPTGLEVGRHSRNHRDLSERVASETRVVVRPGENGGAMESAARDDSTEKHSQRQRET